MSKLLTIAAKDIRVLFRDPAALLLMLGGPLVLSLGLGLVSGAFSDSGDSGIPVIPVVVVDRDGGQLAAALVDVFESDELAELVAPTFLADPAEARRLVEAEDMVAAVIVPPGFSDSIIPAAASDEPSASPLTIEIYSDPGRPVSAGIVRSIVDQFMAQTEIGAAAAGLAIDELLRQGAFQPVEFEAQMAAVTSELMSAGDSTLIVIERSDAAAVEETDFNAMAYIAPSMALLFLMYTVTMGARAFIQERDEGTLPRMLTAPTTTTQIFGGKVLGIFLSGVLQTGLLVLATTLLFGLRWGSPLGVVALVSAAAAAATGWGLLLAAVSRTQGQAASMGTALMLIFGILGGSFVSLSNAGPLVDALSKITPNAWAIDGFSALALGEGFTALAVPLAALLTMAAVLFVIAVLVFRRRQSEFLAG